MKKYIKPFISIDLFNLSDVLKTSRFTDMWNDDRFDNLTDDTEW